MSNNVFDPIDPIRFGWNTLKSNLKFFFVLMVIVAVLYNLPSLIWTLILSQAAASDSSIIIAVFALIAVTSGIIYLVMELGLLDISLSFRDGLLPQIQDLFRQYPLLLKYLAAYIIYSLMVFIGFMLLIVRGIYLGLKYQHSHHYDHFHDLHHDPPGLDGGGFISRYGADPLYHIQLYHIRHRCSGHIAHHQAGYGRYLSNSGGETCGFLCTTCSFGGNLRPWARDKMRFEWRQSGSLPSAPTAI